MLNINGIAISSDYGNLIKGVAAEFAAVYDDTAKTIQPMASKIFTVQSGTGAMQTFKNVGGVDALKKVEEGKSLPELNKYLGGDAQFRFNTYGGIVTVSKNAIEDTDYRSELEAFRKLVVSGQTTMDKHAFQVLNSAYSLDAEFNGANITRLSDGKPLLSIAHPLANGFIESNVLESSPALSPSSVAALRTLILNTSTESGEPMNFVNGFYLVVPTELKDLAERIVKSNLLQGTPNNDINTLSDIEVFSTPFLSSKFGGSDTAYFLVSKDSNGLKQIIRQSLNYEAEVDFNTKNLKNSVDGRWAQGYTDWRGVVGSRGDGSTIIV